MGEGTEGRWELGQTDIASRVERRCGTDYIIWLALLCFIGCDSLTLYWLDSY